MLTQPNKNSILLVDDKEMPREALAELLRGEGYRVEVAESTETAFEKLKKGFCPTFIFTDRQFPDQMIEERALSEFKRLAPDSLVIVFTRQIELSRRDHYAIRAAGAVRILDTKSMGTRIAEIKALTTEVDELLEFRSDLRRATESRDRLLAAVTGSSVGLTIIDQFCHVWFANEAQEQIVGGPCAGGLCWNQFDGHPPEMGPCWGCGVCHLFATGEISECVILTRTRSGQMLWVSIQTTPIYARDGVTIIAAREAVSPHTERIVASMGSKNRLSAIAQGLLHIGFGRVRIYEIADYQPDSKNTKKTLCAAASYKDKPSDREGGAYMRELGSMSLDLSDCRYCSKAIAERKGLFLREWDADGPSSIAKRLSIEPPYFAVPILSPEGDTIVGFLGADFGDMEEAKRKCAIEYLAKEETLGWLRESIGLEVRNALLGNVVESPEALMRYTTVQRARLEVGGAVTESAATQALTRAFAAVLPAGCLVSIRRKDGDTLVTEEEFHCACNAESEEVITLNNTKSLAIYVIHTHHGALWIDNYPAYRAEAIAENRPPGLSTEDTASVAHIPLSFEGTVYGSLSIDSPKSIRWHEDGLVDPLMRLGPLTALVLREIHLHALLDKGKSNNAALVAFAATATRDAIWRHWAIQRLQTLSTTASRIHTERERLRSPVDEATRRQIRSELEDVGYGLDNIADLLKKSYPGKDEFTSPLCELSDAIVVIREKYEKRGVAFSKVEQEYWIAIPRLFLRRIIGFLLDNALEATGEQANPKISIEYREVDQKVYVIVSDNGPGIPEAIHSTLLKEPVKSARKGEGLGLLICRGTALQYGGDLTIENFANPTRVSLCLPAAKKGDA